MKLLEIIEDIVNDVENENIEIFIKENVFNRLSRTDSNVKPYWRWFLKNDTNSLVFNNRQKDAKEVNIEVFKLRSNDDVYINMSVERDGQVVTDKILNEIVFYIDPSICKEIATITETTIPEIKRIMKDSFIKNIYNDPEFKNIYIKTFVDNKLYVSGTNKIMGLFEKQKLKKRAKSFYENDLLKIINQTYHF